jgi:outer membrane lipoprotein-sorting protein
VNNLVRHFKLYRRDFFISIVAGLGVAAIMVGVRLTGSQVSASSLPADHNGVVSAVPLPQLLSDKSSVSDVVALMQDSQNKWQSLDLTATTLWYGPHGDTQSVNTTVQIQQFARARMHGTQTSSTGQVMSDMTWLSDGQLIYEQDNVAKIYTQHVLPAYALSPDAAAAVATRAPNDAVVRQPMAILMPSALGDYIYPSGLMQRKGTVTIEGPGEVSGRPAIVIHWDGQGSPARYWVDEATGLILRAESYGGDGPNGVFEETTVTRISYGQLLPSATFAFQPLPGAKFVDYDTWQGSAPK